MAPQVGEAPMPMQVNDDDDNNNNQITEKVTKKERTTKDLAFYQLLSYADGFDWSMMVFASLGSVVHGLAQPVGYLLLGKALNAFGDNINDTHAMVSALYKIGCWMYASERQVCRLRLAFLRAVLSQEVGAFDTDLTSGKVITGITDHMCIIQDAIGEKLGHFIASCATFFCGVLIAFISCWEVSLLTLFVIPMIFIIGATYTKKMNTISTVRMSYMSEVTSMVEQTISQIKTVFAFVGENRAIKSFKKCLEKQVKIGKQGALIKGVGTGMFQAVTFCSWALIVWVGAVVVSAKRSTGGDVIAAVMSILFGAISLTYAAPDLQVFNQAKAAGKEVFGVLKRKPKICPNSSGRTLEKIQGNIDIKDVYFAYPSRPEQIILQGFSLSIPAGKVVALVGSSGCGKSTILSLITRFYEPEKGEIFIDKCNIKDLDLKCLRRNIGVVSQEPSLFAGTIKDNLQVGKLEADDEEIQKAADLANAHSFISQLPDQYLTQVGQQGFQLSGGQKQRIAIARAILKDPPILLLDEATSALDSESEKLVQDALERAMQGRTVILIAHRLSTIVNADMIVIVENGRVAESGTHESLLETSEFYNTLFSMQNISQESGPSETQYREMDLTEETGSIELQNSFRSEEPTPMNKKQTDSTGEQELKKGIETMIFFRIWFGLTKEEFCKAFIGSVAAAFAGISKPVFGFFIITIGVEYYKSNSKQKVGILSVLFSSIGLLSLLAHTMQHYLFGVVGEKVMTNLRQALYTAVLRNELSWFERPENSVGSVTTRIIHETSTVKTIISDRLSVIVQCISSILIATTVSIKVNWRMGLVAWAVMPSKGFASDSTAAHSELVTLASESATNIKTIVSFCHEEPVLEKAALSLKKPLRKSRRESIKYGLIQGVSLCLWNIAHAVALWYTTILVERGQSSFEDGIRSYQIFSLTVPSITELWTLIPTVLSAISILTPVYETLDRCTEIEPDTPMNTSSERIKGHIEFRRVHFNYPSRPEMTILDNFSLKIEAGSRVAIVGPSGAGKSSVLALLLRFYDAKSGKVLIDSKNVKDYNLRNLRAHIGLVQQEPLLFSFSIRENICYGNEGASESEIIEVSKEANICDFISSLPDGYDTVVGEKGCQLSGGQKQRIAIARALLKRPAIMLLDEATSALDAESEKAMTRVTIAHRLSTVMNSDNIVVMDRGKVVEMGSHSSLLASSDGIYSKLCKLQSIKD
ncbi:hypothetical protein M9H77_26247 [Catharanthus roseus]|uniref:Uncharacterized protein n=1 Tax=Catharanthus roseus TaxID=4058 RepID=A0ACC0AA01_CATRO|nr:hypothetical protein M9H77_26247 [Catharanthus roseus]